MRVVGEQVAHDHQPLVRRLDATPIQPFYCRVCCLHVACCIHYKFVSGAKVRQKNLPCNYFHKNYEN
jgi:hypothetical protein